MWVFPNTFGLFKIQPVRTGRFGLFIDDELLGVYDGPHEAAQAVLLCETGFTPWDQLRPPGRPTGLDDWGLAFSPGGASGVESGEIFLE